MEYLFILMTNAITHAIDFKTIQWFLSYDRSLSYDYKLNESISYTRINCSWLKIECYSKSSYTTPTNARMTTIYNDLHLVVNCCPGGGPTF